MSYSVLLVLLMYLHMAASSSTDTGLIALIVLSKPLLWSYNISAPPLPVLQCLSLHFHYNTHQSKLNNQVAIHQEILTVLFTLNQRQAGMANLGDKWREKERKARML